MLRVFPGPSLPMFLEPFVLVHLVQIDAIEPSRLYPQQVRFLAPDEHCLPRRFSVFHGEVPLPLWVLRADEGRVTRLPALLPVEAVVLGLPDADIAQDQPL